MKTQSVIGKSLLFALAFVVTILVGCDDFMSSDDDFKKKLEDEVKIANAPKIQIRVQAESGTGTVSPNGMTTVKMEVPFSLLFQPSNEYGFLRWEAYSTDGTAESLSGVVSFEKPDNPETMATLLVNRNDVLIRPVCVQRPSVSGTNPTSGRVDVVRNYPAKIYFSKQMDPASFQFEDGSKRKDGKFKNIEISGLFGDPDTAEYVPYEQYFSDPELNVTQTGKTLIIRPMEGNLPKSYSVIRITVKKDITDTTGLAMAQDVTFEYTLNNQEDKTPPVIDTNELKGGRTSGFEFASDPSTHRTINEPVWLSVSASDAATGGGNVISVSVSHRRLYDTNGTVQSAAPVENTVIYGFNPTEDNLNVMEFQHDLGAVPDGVYELLIQATDSNQNITKIENAVKYIVVRDTTAPAVQSGKITHSGATVAGWFNNAANKTITFTPSQVIEDQGVDASGDRPRTRSATVQWQFVIGAANTVATPWASAASPLPTVLSTQIEDGAAIPVQVRFRDDLGNTSAYFPYNPIMKDSVPPTGTITINHTTPIAGVGDMIGSNNASVQVNAIDTTSGRYQFIVRPNNTPPTLADTWNDFHSDPTQRTNATVTFTGGDGAKTAYLWVRDKADNISAVVTASAIVDSMPPVINKVYVQDDAWTNMSGAPSGSPGDQYSNATDLYANFFVEAYDEGAGVKEFQVSTDRGHTYSIPFAIGSYAGDQAGPVRNVHVAGPFGAQKIVYIFGQIRMPGNQGRNYFGFKVRDAVGGESGGMPNDAGSNDFIYDTMAPAVDSVSVTNPGLFHNGTVYYVNSTNPTVIISARDYKAGSEIVSGIKNAVFTSTNLSGPPPTITISASPEVAGPLTGTASVTLTGTDGSKNLEFTLYDYAGNALIDTTTMIPIYLDLTKPTFVMTLKNGATVFATKQADSDSVVLGADPAYSRNNSVPVTLSSVDDGAGSGITAGAVHTLNVYQKIGSGTETRIQGPTPIASDYSGTITLPSASAIYTAEVLLRDNVDNICSGRLGFHYDATAPVITNPNSLTTFTVYDGSGNASYGVVYDGRVYVPGRTVRLSVEATDIPGSDPGGSGLSAIETQVYYTSGAVIINWRGVLSESESPKYVKEGASSNLILPENEVTKITAGVTDKAGNTVWSHGTNVETSTFVIVADTAAPALTEQTVLTYGASYMKAGLNYIKDPAFNIEAFDHYSASEKNSGVVEWGLSETSAAPASWNAYTTGVVDGTAALRTFLGENQSTPVYVFCRDRVGNVSASTDANAYLGQLYLDDADPVITSFEILRNDEIDHNSNTYTTEAAVKVPLNVSDAGAGISTITIGGTGLDTVTGFNTMDPNEVLSGSTLTFTEPVSSFNNEFDIVLTTTGAVSKQITVTITDAVGNDITQNASINLDTTPPVIEAAPAVTGVPGNGGYYIKSPVTAGFTESAGTTDVDRWMIDYSATAGYSNIYAANQLYTGAVSEEVTSFFSSAESRPLHAHVIDTAGNVGNVPLTSNPVTLDGEVPVITVAPLNPTWGSRDITLELNITESLSGITRMEITGDVDLPSSSLTDWNASMSGSVLILDHRTPASALRSDSSYQLPVTFTEGDGTKKVKVKLYDAVGNPSVVSNEVETLLDSERPEVAAMWLKRTDGKGETATGDNSDLYTTGADKVDLHIRFTEAGQGLKSIIFDPSMDTGFLSSVALTAGIDVVGGSPAAPTYTVSDRTITFTGTNPEDRPRGTSAELIIRGVSLTEGEGDNTVTLGSVIDGAGGSAMALPSAVTITLDTQPPEKSGTSTFSPLAHNTVTNTWWVKTPVSATGIAASDVVSSVSKYAFAADPTTTAPDKSTISTFTLYSTAAVDVSTYFDTEEARYLYVYFMDEAGNISDGAPVYTNPVRIDNTAPTDLTVVPSNPLSCYLKGSTYYYKEFAIEFTPTATETGSGIAGYTTQSNGSGATLTLTFNSTGTYSIYAVDRLNNISTRAQVTVMKDTAGPTGIWLHDRNDDPPAGVYWEGGSSSTYWVKTSTAITYSPYSLGDDSGIKGYSTTTNDASSAALTLDLTPANYKIYAYDNLDNESSSQTFLIKQDTTAPIVTGMTLSESDDKWHIVGTTFHTRGTAGNLTVTVSGATDNESGFKGYLLNGTTLIPEGGTFTVTKDDVSFTLSACDNVDNSTTPVTYTIQQNSGNPVVTNFSLTSTDPTFRYVTVTNTVYFNGAASYPIELTPGGAVDAGSSGIKGYTATQGVSNASLDPLSISGSPFTVWVYDNVAHESSVSDITVVWDTAAPELSIKDLNNRAAEQIYDVTIRDVGIGLDAIEIRWSTDTTFDASDKDLAWAPSSGDTASVTGLTGLNTGAPSDYIRFTITDKYGKQIQKFYKRDRPANNKYTLTEYTPTNPSMNYRPRTVVPADPRVPAQAGFGSSSYADPFAVETSYTRQTPAAAPVARTRTNGTLVAATATGSAAKSAAERTGTAETVNAENADETVAVPKDASSIQAAALARSGMSPLQRRSLKTRTEKTRTPAQSETPAEEVPDTHINTQQDSETPHNKTVSGDAEPASAPDGGTPEPTDNTPRRNTGMPYCMPGNDSRRDDEEDEFQEV